MKADNDRKGLLQTFTQLSGNQRACLYTEPLWGIPYQLYLPFVSVYMAALGLTLIQIGVVSTVFLSSQMVWALLGGIVTDKLGRRLTTLIFNLISWSLPTMLWAFAQDYRWFVAAALLNGAWRVTETSWGLLMIEDAKQEQLVHLYSIMRIAGLVAGFFAPVAYFFVQHYSVVPAMRVLYGFAFIIMTFKFFLLYQMASETSVGVRRKAETKDVSLLTRLWDSRTVLLKMLRSRRIMLTMAFIACFGGLTSINNTFWPLLVTEKLGIAPENLSLFSTLKTLLMLASYLFLVPRLNLQRFRNPVLLGLLLFLLQEMLLLWMPQGAYWLVLCTVVLEALALSMLNPLATSLQMVNIDREERARMLGFFYAICMFVTSPIGTLAGALAQINRAFPYILSVVLTLAASLLTFVLWRIGLPDSKAPHKPQI